MRLRLLSVACDEIRNALEYYEGEQTGLGEAFWREVDQHLLWTLDHFETPRIRKRVYRRVNLDRFPFYIAYIVRDDEIVVVAVAHSHREPEYWINRI